MVEQGFPNSHTTTTAVQPESKPNIYMDLSYLRTKAGVLKCAQILCNLLGFICILSSILRYTSRGNWFVTVAMGGLTFTGIMLVLYIFHVTDKLSIIPWLMIEFCFCALWTFFYLLAASLAAGYGIDEGFAAAAFFGFVAMVLYGCDAFLKFVQIKFSRNVRNTASVGATVN
ncbi:UNVERIFIED_CONTAM: hypothetical protein PYX00_006505 [Menopon gallinae]|uniref:MARVEL domain-containing protein n=1 Tax=Menopon gallinae TaxID=328185 RepID=A0AAW2HX28_9NEOP